MENASPRCQFYVLIQSEECNSSNGFLFKFVSMFSAKIAHHLSQLFVLHVTVIFHSNAQNMDRFDLYVDKNIV